MTMKYTVSALEQNKIFLSHIVTYIKDFRINLGIGKSLNGGRKASVAKG